MAQSFSYVLKLTVFFVFMLNNGVTCYQKWDCAVHDKDLFLEKRSFVPKFGQSPTVVRFNSEDKLKQFIEDATKVYQAVVRGNNLNTLDAFLQLYEDSKKPFAQNASRLLQYFAKYQYKFRARENGLSLAIEVLERVSAMSDKYPEVRNKGFLASAPSIFQVEEISNYVLPDNESKLMKMHSVKLINAVAAYKIQVQSKTVLVIFNAEYYYGKPIVLVQGLPADPLNSNIGIDRSTKYVHRFFKEYSEDYILVEVYFSNNPNVLFCYEIIYVGKSYCSFMETTDKRYLAHPLKSIFKRGNGNDFSGFQVNLQPVSEGNVPELNTFLYVTLNETTKIVNEKSFAIALKGSGRFDKDISNIYKERLVNVGNAIGLTYEDLIAKLTSLKDILANQLFVETIVYIDAIMYNDDPRNIDKILKEGRFEDDLYGK